MARNLRALFDEKGKKTPLDDVFNVWATHVQSGVGPIGTLKQLYKHRHWLAHGRYWSDKSGITPTVDDALQRFRASVQLIRTVERDFPRMRPR